MSKGNRTRRQEELRAAGNNNDGTVVWADGRSPVNRCAARRRDGEPCGMAPIRGATVCRKHGGAAPQVKRKAQERLLDGVPKMLRMLQSLASDETVPPAVRLAAIRDWLDRAGIDRKIEVEIGTTGFQELLAGAVASLEDVSADTAITYEYLDNIQAAGVIEGELVDD